MNRREIVTGLAALGTTTLAACAARAHGPAHATGAHHPATTPLSPQLSAVLSSATRCRTAGAICLAHCTDNLAAGDAHMAGCQRAVMNMLSVVSAMQEVAAYHSAEAASIAALARACAAFCRACEAQCAPHIDHHAECKECSEACRECAEACDALAAA